MLFCSQKCYLPNQSRRVGGSVVFIKFNDKGNWVTNVIWNIILLCNYKSLCNLSYNNHSAPRNPFHKTDSSAHPF